MFLVIIAELSFFNLIAEEKNAESELLIKNFTFKLSASANPMFVIFKDELTSKPCPTVSGVIVKLFLLILISGTEIKSEETLLSKRGFDPERLVSIKLKLILMKGYIAAEILFNSNSEGSCTVKVSHFLLPALYPCRTALKFAEEKLSSISYLTVFHLEAGPID
jgi:hypothetical protein